MNGKTWPAVVTSAKQHVVERLRGVLPGARAWSRDLPVLGRRLIDWALHTCRRLDPRENRAAAVTALVGAVLAVVGFVIAKNAYDNSAGQEFRQQSAHYTQVVERALQNYTIEVRDAKNLFGSAPDRIDRWEFFEYAKARLPRFPGLKTLVWAPRVPAGSIKEYETNARNDGLFGFEFKQQDSIGTTEPVPQRPVYFPAYYVEPFEGNEAVLGYDLVADERLKAAANTAVMTGELVAAKPVGWLNVHGATDPFVLLQPVFRGERTPDTVEDRKERLAGFVVGIVDVAGVFDLAVRDYTTPAWIDVYLYETILVVDEEAGVPAEQRHGRLVSLHASPLRSGEDYASLRDGPKNSRYVESHIDLAGEQLAVVIAGVPGKYQAGNNVVPWAVLAIVALLTAVLVQYLVSLRRHQRVLGQRMAERTTQLREARELNAALRKEVRRRMRVERQLRDAKNQAEVANRAKSDFLAMVSHELRTPLNAIIGFSEILTDEMFGPIGEKRYSGYAGDIRTSAQHLLSLINNILDLTRVESNHYALDESNVDLPQLIADSVHLLDAKATAAGLEISVDCDRTTPVVLGDELALRQIVINLLQNAVKFTPRGGRISVGSYQMPAGEVVIEVSDTGIGIAAADLARVLEPFVQADTSLARRYEGAGLGLPLSKKLAEMHDGTLEIESAPDAGTTVRLVLPAGRTVKAVRLATG